MKTKKMFNLNLHWKQGDDLASHLERTKGDASQALLNWGMDFERRSKVCAQIADALKNKSVDIEADTHHISIQPKDKDAEQVLLTLVEQELLEAVDFD